jgi:hypothetical protein
MITTSQELVFRIEKKKKGGLFVLNYNPITNGPKTVPDAVPTESPA